MELRSAETIKQAVIAGMGLTFLSAHTISLELAVGNLAVLDVQGFPMMLSWYLVHRRNKRLPPVAQAFREFLMREGATLIKEITGIDPPRTRGASAGNGHTVPVRKAPREKA
jgi:DNA-binding transcriptional LysR family regulator